MNLDKNRKVIRIPDTKFYNLINKVSRQAIYNEDAASQNDFLQQMLRVGINDYMRTHKIQVEDKNVEDDAINKIFTIDTLIVSIKSSLDKVTDYLVTLEKVNKAYNDALILLCSEVLNILLDVSIGVPVDKEDIDNSFYDDIPDKIKEILKEFK